MNTRKALTSAIVLIIILLLATVACITMNIPAPTPLPTHTPLPTASPIPSPTSFPEQDLEMREKDEPLSAHPDLFQFSVTLIERSEVKPESL